MTQLILASSFFQALTLAALKKEGKLSNNGGRQILVVANNSPKPEIVSDFRTAKAAEVLLSYFDQVVSLNDAVWPIHPRSLNIRPEDARTMRRYLSSEWHLPNAGIELIVESLPNPPGGALAKIFRDAPISMISDGLMSYGPLRNPVAPEFRHRLDSVYYTDLIAGLQPVRLGSHEPNYVAGTATAMKSVVDELTEDYFSHTSPTQPWPKDASLILAQYLTDLDAISKDEEARLHKDMIDASAESNASAVVFKPHPASSPALLGPMRRHANELGLEFIVERSPASAELLMNKYQPKVVVSCFSTGLATAAGLFGSKSVAVGTELMLERFAPFENSNRIPVTIADAVFKREVPVPDQDENGTGEDAELQRLVNAVSYCMQPVNEAHLRGTAVAYLSSAVGTERMKYFKKRRLTALELPGAISKRPKSVSNVRKSIRAAHRLYRTSDIDKTRLGSIARKAMKGS